MLKVISPRIFLSNNLCSKVCTPADDDVNFSKFSGAASTGTKLNCYNPINLIEILLRKKTVNHLTIVFLDCFLLQQDSIFSSK